MLLKLLMEGSSFVLIIFVPHISGGPQRMISYHIVCVRCVAAIVERIICHKSGSSTGCDTFNNRLWSSLNPQCMVLHYKWWVDGACGCTTSVI